MADLLSLLSMGANALTTQTAASATTSHNLANVNTPGYSRQRANLAAMLPAFRLGGSFIGQGVTLDSVTQARDFGAEKQFISANDNAASSKAQSEALQSLSAFDPDTAGNLGGALSDFYSSMRALAQNPSDMSLRQAALGDSQAAALAFNRTSGAISDARGAIDTQLSGNLGQVNSLATQMASLNSQIRIARASGAQPNDLLDARQSTQDALIGLTGAVPVPDQDGNVNLSLPGGAGLVSGDHAAQLSLKVDTANDNHYAVQMTRTDGTGPFDVTSLGGTYGGLLSARDGGLKTAQTSVDQLAFDWSNTVNTVHTAGYGLDGVNGRNLFDAGATAAGAAARITVSTDVGTDATKIGAAAAPGAQGDAVNLQALIGTENTALSTGSSVLGAWSSVVSGYGTTAAQSISANDANQAVLEHVTGLRDATSGVSTDEELVELQKSQRGYEAVMKVITTADDMLDTLMTLKST